MVFHETNKLSSNITWGHSKTLNVIPYLYLIFKVELLVTESHLLNLSMKGWNSVFNAQGSKIYTINSLRSSVTELGSVTKSWPGPAQHSRTLEFPPTGFVGGVSGRVCHKRSTGLSPALPMAVTKLDVKELCVFGEGGRRWRERKSHEWVVQVTCFALEGRGCLELGTVNSTNPRREKEFKEEKCCSNEVDQQRISWETF